MTSVATPPVLQPSPEILNSAVEKPETPLHDFDDDVTQATPRNLKKTKSRSIDDLRLLAISSQITEVCYSIGELQSRIFEIQELRHRSHEPTSPTTNGRKSSDSTASSTSTIDNALGQLDVRLDTVSRSISAIATALEPLSSTGEEPPLELEEAPMVLRKYQDMETEWNGVQAEAKMLREELKEDKWLAVFRTTSEQAEGMMASLDKALGNCQDFIQTIYANTKISSDRRASSVYSDKSVPNLASYDELVKAYEAKKKYYLPSTTKVMNSLNKGIEDRLTKNGECLRKYADMKSRWDALRIKIKRVDHEMDKVRKILLDIESSEADSVVSETSISLAASPPMRSSRAPSNASTTSALGKFASKVSNALGRNTPNGKHAPPSHLELPPQHTRTISRRTSFLPFRSPGSGSESFKMKGKMFNSSPGSTSAPTTATTLADEWIDLGNGRSTIKATKPRWNASTRPDNSTDPPPLPPVPSGYRPPSSVALTPPRRPPSSANRYGPGSKPPTSGPPPVPPRSVARPYTPVRIVANGNYIDQSPESRPASRAQSSFGLTATPRARPKTPSMIPAPRFLGAGFSSAGSVASDDALDVMSTPFSIRAFSPAPSAAPSAVGNGGSSAHRRRPSNSHIPLPVRSRTTSPVNSPNRALSPARSPPVPNLPRSQTPDLSPSSQRTRPHHQTSASTSVLTPGRSSLRPSLGRGPPSSFRDGSLSGSAPATRAGSSTRTSNSRPSSRAGAATPSHELTQGPLYIPQYPHDPLDAEVAKVVNSVPHGLTIQRTDPPVKNAPKEGDVLGQYVISNNLGQKTLACKVRVGGDKRRVMCRVGGGWMDLTTYMNGRYSL